ILTCIYSAFILRDNEVDQVTVTEDKLNALIKMACVNVKRFWSGLFAKALASVNIRSLTCSVGTRGPSPSAAAPAKNKTAGAKKQESEESDNNMCFSRLD
uniref:Large ribosomal subunit protein P1 n=1 Tax=Cavia porcellus TaxID=10141 RepID=A0A286XGV1_CAVPO